MTLLLVGIVIGWVLNATMLKPLRHRSFMRASQQYDHDRPPYWLILWGIFG